jgi:hypothetical protein
MAPVHMQRCPHMPYDAFNRQWRLEEQATSSQVSKNGKAGQMLTMICTRHYFQDTIEPIICFKTENAKTRAEHTPFCVLREFCLTAQAPCTMHMRHAYGPYHYINGIWQWALAVGNKALFQCSRLKAAIWGQTLPALSILLTICTLQSAILLLSWDLGFCAS